MIQRAVRMTAIRNATFHVAIQAVRSATILVAFLFLSPAISFAQVWLTGEGEVVVSNISPEEAKRKAFELAREDALAKAGLEITGVSGRHIEEGSDYYDNFIRFTLTRTKGLIVEQETLEAGLQMRSVPGGEPVPIYRAKIRAKVITQTGEPDPAFQVQLNLNRLTYRDSESIEFTLRASKDCYITVFNLYGNDSLTVVFPSIACSDNHLSKDQTLAFPPQGYTMPVSLLPGSKDNAEAFLAIATRDDIHFHFGKSIERENLVAQGDALLAINRWLADIPLAQRTQAWEFYRVVK